MKELESSQALVSKIQCLRCDGLVWRAIWRSIVATALFAVLAFTFSCARLEANRGDQMSTPEPQAILEKQRIVTLRAQFREWGLLNRSEWGELEQVCRFGSPGGRLYAATLLMEIGEKCSSQREIAIGLLEDVTLRSVPSEVKSWASFYAVVTVPDYLDRSSGGTSESVPDYLPFRDAARLIRRNRGVDARSVRLLESALYRKSLEARINALYVLGAAVTVSDRWRKEADRICFEQALRHPSEQRFWMMTRRLLTRPLK